jgi:hypothetical protein
VALARAAVAASVVYGIVKRAPDLVDGGPGPVEDLGQLP